jgi:DNA polymerase III subunit alpha
MAPKFVHLHLHSEYSLVDGLIRIPDLISHCALNNTAAIALTDQSNVFGSSKFFRAAMSAGVKPIIGVELWVAEGGKTSKPYKVVFLCQNNFGYKNLSFLLTKAYREGQRIGIPILNEDWLNALSLKGIICLSGGIYGDVGAAFLANNGEGMLQSVSKWQALFGERYYLEIFRTGRPKEEQYLQEVASIAEDLGVPLVATNDVRFIRAEEYEVHEARVCIQQGRMLADPRRPKLHSEEQHLRTEEEMVELFKDIPSAISNSVSIALQCNLEFDFDTYHLPEYPVSEGENVNEVLNQKTRLGLNNRFDTKAVSIDTSDSVRVDEYIKRLDIELSVIIQMGFSGYFLIVSDFIEWAKLNDIPVGPGRGSGAGSLAAFALGITELDPIKYELLFERFLNPERVSMPDFDIDFCMERRDEVIDYVSRKYGREKVSQIITYGKMAAKGVLRDVGRILGFPYIFIDQLAKLIPFEPAMTLEKALVEEPVLSRRYNNEEDVKSIFDLAQKLEGLARNAGKHAGGVVIAPTDLTNFMPLYCEEGSDSVVSQFDMNDIEAIGLVKFDFLGLRTLTIIDWALKDINRVLEQKGLEKIVILRIPLDDLETFQLIQSGDTTAVFQLESKGMQDLIRRLQPDKFDDLIALVALFRPGPLQSGMVDDFIERKHGRASVEYINPSLEPILNVTNGVILYQEQVMEIARVMAGYTLGAADLLRRAMGKKKVEEMSFQRENFVVGSASNGVKKKDSTAIFDLMEKFAGYGFNKSHSAAYALLAYQTAWLKTHHAAAFMAAVLSADMDSTDKVVRIIEESRKMKLEVVSPDINSCIFRFTVSDPKTILYGLGAIKGLGESVVSSLVSERSNRGPYKNLMNLCQRNSSKRINRKALEVLIKSGALDGFAVPRHLLIDDIERVLKATDQASRDTNTGQTDLFGLALFATEEEISSLDGNAPSKDILPWSEETVLAYEKETLGLYLSGHPINRYKEEFISISICSLSSIFSGTKMIAGLINSVRLIKTRRGRMAILLLDDGTARVEVVVYNDVYEEHISKLSNDRIVVIDVSCGEDKYSGEFRIEAISIRSVDETRAKLASALVLSVTDDIATGALIEKFGDILKGENGSIPVSVEFTVNEANARLNFSEKWNVCLNNELLDKLAVADGISEVKIEY